MVDELGGWRMGGEETARISAARREACTQRATKKSLWRRREEEEEVKRAVNASRWNGLEESCWSRQVWILGRVHANWLEIRLRFP